MPESSRRYHYTQADGTEVDQVVSEDQYPQRNVYGHPVRMEIKYTYPDGREKVHYRDINGDLVRYEWTFADGSVQDAYKDASGRWWVEKYDSDGYLTEQLTTDDDPVAIGFPNAELREPEEGEEPTAFTSQGQRRGGEPDNPPIDLPPGLELKDPWTHTDPHGNVHFAATDQYGRQWDWFRDAQGNTSIGYRDEDGNWHDTYQDQDGSWHDTWTDPAGTEHYGYTDKDGNWHGMHRGPDGVWLADDPADESMTWKDYQRWRTDEFGNEHFSYLDQHGNRHEEWTDARTGEHHDVVIVNDPNAPDGWRNAEPGEIEGPLGEAMRNQAAGEAILRDNPELLDNIITEMNRNQITLDMIRDNPELLDSILGSMNRNPTVDPNLLDPELVDSILGPRIRHPDLPYLNEPEGQVDPDDLVPYRDYIPFFRMVQDPTTGEWRNAEPGEIPGPGEGGWPERGPAGEYTIPEIERPDLYGPGTVPPAGEEGQQPPGDDDGGYMGLGVPYRDFIPFFPMVQDPTTGEWRNAEPGEIPELQSGDPNAPVALSNLFDPNAPGPTLDPSLFNPNAAGPTLDLNLLIDRDGPAIDPALLDPSAPGPTLDPALLDPNSPGLTLDPALLDPNSPGPTIDLNLLDPSVPGPTIDPSLLDPNSPGITLDPALLDPAAPGPTLDPNTLDPTTPGPTVDPSTLDTSLMEPAGVMDPSSTDPSLTEPPRELGAPDQGFDDTLNP